MILQTFRSHCFETSLCSASPAGFKACQMRSSCPRGCWRLPWPTHSYPFCSTSSFGWTTAPCNSSSHQCAWRRWTTCAHFQTRSFVSSRQDRLQTSCGLRSKIVVTDRPRWRLTKTDLNWPSSTSVPPRWLCAWPEYLRSIRIFLSLTRCATPSPWLK